MAPDLVVAPVLYSSTKPLFPTKLITVHSGSQSQAVGFKAQVRHITNRQMLLLLLLPLLHLLLLLLLLYLLLLLLLLQVCWWIFWYSHSTLALDLLD